MLLEDPLYAETALVLTTVYHWTNIYKKISANMIKK